MWKGITGLLWWEAGLIALLFFKGKIGSSYYVVAYAFLCIGLAWVIWEEWGKT